MKPAMPILAVVAGLMSAGLSGCDYVKDLVTEKKIPLKGERIAVMRYHRNLQPDPQVADLRVMLPPPVANRDWPQSGGFPSHAMHHLQIAPGIGRAWSIDIGSGSSDERRLMSFPIVVAGLVFAMDVDFEVSAFDVRNGERVWGYAAKVPDEDEDAFGGGLAYDGGRIFVTTGYGRLIALRARDGAELWQQNISGPSRAAPTAAGGRVFVVTIDNQLSAHNAETGKREWSHSGISEIAGLLGGSSPAVAGETLVVPYSSGEVFALRVANGRVTWSDNLIALRRVDALSTLAHIRGHPVIDRGLVYAMSHSGRLVAIDLRTGTRVWDRAIGGVETPWAAGNFVYVMSNEGELYCLTRRGGRVRWVRPLPRFEDPEDKDDPIKWFGPVLASDRLVLAGSHGEALAISPYTGEVLGRIDLPDNISMAPVVAGDTLYFLTDDGDHVADR
jgi:outer membrane protein assembly factor BamB